MTLKSRKLRKCRFWWMRFHNSGAKLSTIHWSFQTRLSSGQDLESYLSPSGSGPRPFTRTPFPNNTSMVEYTKKLNFRFMHFLSCVCLCFLFSAFQWLSVFQLERARCKVVVVAFFKIERQLNGFQRLVFPLVMWTNSVLSVTQPGWNECSLSFCNVNRFSAFCYTTRLG